MNALLLEVGEWVLIDISIKNEIFITHREGAMMKVEVSCLIGGMDIKEIVHVDKFEDAEKVAKSRNEFCRQISRKILIE